MAKCAISPWSVRGIITNFSSDRFLSMVVWKFGKSVLNKMFVPAHAPLDPKEVEALQELLNKAKKLFVMTGAGCSTESGIPDYRSPGTGVYSSGKEDPVDFSDFVANNKARQRYWARNFVIWPTFNAAKPNITHQKLAEWEKSDRFLGIVTQNTDGLHMEAGSTKVIELHGNCRKIVCLGCDYTTSRDQFQEVIAAANPNFVTEVQKPERINSSGQVEFDRNLLQQCDTFLVLGSSLYVSTGANLVLQAASGGKSLALVTIGHAELEGLFNVKLNAPCGPVMSQLQF
ncbi:unnamed protein product [Cyprideis torosa]|uniref:Uncharacterized protein n=1 Tax=Cyprideis torosa TaxID=163714 RepID=A0A7R8W3B7_9CRUS|nr:unnamed protein product [Cyprideis torosa]CAG0882718.1 unnamed protein product [Cyprideis torosa]